MEELSTIVYLIYCPNKDLWETNIFFEQTNEKARQIKPYLASVQKINWNILSFTPEIIILKDPKPEKNDEEQVKYRIVMFTWT
jgi:hypothetical protein